MKTEKEFDDFSIEKEDTDKEISTATLDDEDNLSPTQAFDVKKREEDLAETQAAFKAINELKSKKAPNHSIKLGSKHSILDEPKKIPAPKSVPKQINLSNNKPRLLKNKINKAPTLAFKRTNNKKPKKSNTFKYALWAAAALVVLGLAYFTFSSLQNFDGTKDKVIVEVNGQKITENNLNNDYNFFFFINGYPEQYSAIITKDLFLNQTIAQILLLKQAKQQGLELSTEFVMQEFEKSLEQNPISKEEFMEKLKQNNFTYGQLIQYTKTQLTLLRFMNESLFNLVTVTDDEATAFYEQHKDEFTQDEQVRAAHILVTTKEEADELVKQIKNNANFSELAAAKSIDPSAKTNHGDLGYFSRGQMVEEFEEVAFALPVGHSTTIKTQFGYHLLKVLDKKPAGTMPYGEIKEDIKNNLLLEKQRKLVQDSIELLKQNSNIKYYS